MLMFLAIGASQQKENDMQYGLVFPTTGVHLVPDLAAEAEAAGWDGVFIPDSINIDPKFNAGVPMETHDPWIVLAAVVLRTESIRFGTMLTAPSRRRPWKLARELTTLDHLSNGRLILSVGLGALDDQGFGSVGEPVDRKTRVQLLNESLDILNGLWSGKPLNYTGKHFTIDNVAFAPTPVQQPRIPIWIVGVWPHDRSMARAARWDGLITAKSSQSGVFDDITPEDIRAMKNWITEHRTATTPFDIVFESSTPADDSAASIAQPYSDAGVTWWLEAFWSPPNDPDAIRERIHAGPPRTIGSTRSFAR
jgi:alkanesulfonate monooxygenase SsuD/methylene tetrahydromethanopterin reductase-like flavin-dependent oxidoreductase (luciferase family)